jgi:Rad3-related DNA helicase
MNLIYLKNLHCNNINLNNLKKNIDYKEVSECGILTNMGIIRELNNKLFNVQYILNLEEENDECYHIKKNIKKNIVYQIPVENKIINIKKIIFNFGKTTNFVIEYFDNKINDFYISIKNDQNLENYFLKQEISYIKKMLI